MAKSIADQTTAGDDEVKKLTQLLNATGIGKQRIEDLKSSNTMGSREREPIQELKELPGHLKYIFLSEDGRRPVIISITLTKQEVEKLIKVLKANTTTIGWSIVDLKGIIPGHCMHKIKVEDEFKPVVKQQRRLNPTMKDVVKKEVFKLLEA